MAGNPATGTDRTDIDTSSNPIDAFIVSKLSEQGLVQAPLADRRTLLRRLYLVLHGIVPTAREVERFVNDPRSDDEVWQQAVDRLMAMPAFGERWARHWMDVVRYAETHGPEHPLTSRPCSWTGFCRLATCETKRKANPSWLHLWIATGGSNSGSRYPDACLR